MLDISFEVAGRKVDLGSMNPGLPRSILGQIRDALDEQVGEITCTEHCCAPRIICSGPSVVELSMQLCGCCDQVLDDLEGRLH